MQNRLVVFAKHWTPGLAKTRLAAALGTHRAAEVHRLALQTTLQRLGAMEADKVVAFTPESTQEDFVRVVSPGWRLAPQGEGDLGQRLESLLGLLRREGPGPIVVIGADTPHIPLGALHQAFAALQSHKLVIGASEDGGYYLLGVQGDAPPIFGRPPHRPIPWGTSRVFAETISSLEAVGWRLGLEYERLGPCRDLDTLDDLAWLVRCNELPPDPVLERFRSALGLLLTDQVVPDAR